jgi:hypothetical protein
MFFINLKLSSKLLKKPPALQRLSQMFTFLISLFWGPFACLEAFRDCDPLIQLNPDPDQYEKP